MIKLNDIELYTLFELAGLRDGHYDDPINGKKVNQIDFIFPYIIDPLHLNDVLKGKDELIKKHFKTDYLPYLDYHKRKKTDLYIKIFADLKKLVNGKLTNDYEKFSKIFFIIRQDENIDANDHYRLVFDELKPNKKDKLVFKRKNLLKSVLENNPDLYMPIFNSVLIQKNIAYQYDIKEAILENKKSYIKSKNIEAKDVEVLNDRWREFLDSYYNIDKGLISEPAYNDRNYNMLLDYFSVEPSIKTYQHVEEKILKNLNLNESLKFNVVKFFESASKTKKEMKDVLSKFNSFVESVSGQKSENFLCDELFIVSYRFSDNKAVELLSSFNQKVSLDNINGLNTNMLTFISNYLSQANNIESSLIKKSDNQKILSFDTREGFLEFKNLRPHLEDTIMNYLNCKNEIDFQSNSENFKTFDSFLKKNLLFNIVKNVVNKNDENATDLQDDILKPKKNKI